MWKKRRLAENIWWRNMLSSVNAFKNCHCDHQENLNLPAYGFSPLNLQFCQYIRKHPKTEKSFLYYLLVGVSVFLLIIIFTDVSGVFLSLDFMPFLLNKFDFVNSFQSRITMRLQFPFLLALILPFLLLLELCSSEVQNITVRGQTICRRRSVKGLPVELREHDTLDPDDSLAATTTGPDGYCFCFNKNINKFKTFLNKIINSFSFFINRHKTFLPAVCWVFKNLHYIFCIEMGQSAFKGK